MKTIDTSAYLVVNSSYANAANSMLAIFAQPMTLSVDSFVPLREQMKQLYPGALKDSTTHVDFTTRNWVRTEFGILWQEVEKLWHGAVEHYDRATTSAQAAAYRASQGKASGTRDDQVSIAVDEMPSSASLIEAALKEFQTGLSQAVADSITGVGSYLADRIDANSKCQQLVRLLNRNGYQTGRTALLELSASMGYFPFTAVPPTSMRPRWELWRIQLRNRGEGDLEGTAKQTWLREVCSEAEFYGLAKLVFGTIDTDPLCGGDISPDYPYPLDRAPEIPEHGHLRMFCF